MVYTQMYLMFCKSSLNRVFICLIDLIFTVGNYILKTNNNNVLSVTIAIYSTFVKLDSLYHIVMLIFFIILYSNFERNYFVC